MDALTARADDPARAGRRLSWSRTLERVADAARTVTGLLWLLVGLAACVTWFFGRAAGGVLFILTGLLAAAFGLCHLVRGYAGGVRLDAALLADTALTVDTTGISWTGARPNSRDWAGLGHIAVTGRPGRRRLIIADASQDVPFDQSAIGAFVGRASRPDRYLLDLPIDAFTVPGDVIVDAIARHSAGRFPDPVASVNPNGHAE